VLRWTCRYRLEMRTHTHDGTGNPNESNTKRRPTTFLQTRYQVDAAMCLATSYQFATARTSCALNDSIPSLQRCRLVQIVLNILDWEPVQTIGNAHWDLPLSLAKCWDCNLQYYKGVTCTQILTVFSFHSALNNVCSRESVVKWNE
jgi:hypothetical protein